VRILIHAQILKSAQEGETYAKANRAIAPATAYA
jgi:hypothetical protein